MGFRRKKGNKKKGSHKQKEKVEDKSQKPINPSELNDNKTDDDDKADVVDKPMSPVPPAPSPPTQRRPFTRLCTEHPECRFLFLKEIKKLHDKLPHTAQPQINKCSLEKTHKEKVTSPDQTSPEQISPEQTSPEPTSSDQIPTVQQTVQPSSEQTYTMPQKITQQMVEEALKAARVSALEGLVEERNVYLDYKEECIKKNVSLKIRAKDFDFIRVSTDGRESFVEFVDRVDELPEHTFVRFHAVALDSEHLYDLMISNVYRHVPALPEMYEQWCTNYLRINIINMKNNILYNNEFQEIAKEQEELLKAKTTTQQSLSNSATTSLPGVSAVTTTTTLTTVTGPSTDKGAIPKVYGYNKKKPTSQTNVDGSGPSTSHVKDTDDGKDKEDIDSMVDNLTFDMKRKLVVRGLQIKNDDYTVENMDIISKLNLIREEIIRHYRGIERLGVNRSRFDAIFEQLKKLYNEVMETEQKK